MWAVVQTIEATLAWRQGSYASAQELLAKALPLLRQADDRWPLHAALADLGFIALNRGDYRAAQAHLDESLAVARAAGNRVNEAIALRNLGWLALVQKNYSTAYARAEASLAIARAVGDISIRPVTPSSSSMTKRQPERAGQTGSATRVGHSYAMSRRSTMDFWDPEPRTKNHVSSVDPVSDVSQRVSKCEPA